MKSIFISALISLLLVGANTDQFKTAKMPRQVSSNQEQEIAPYINMNGNRILYSIKDSHASTWSVEMAVNRRGEWSRGSEISPINAWKNLNLIGGYAIHPNGKEIIFTSKKRGGVGNYDLWVTSEKNGQWSTPENFGKPLNSSSNDAAPSFTREGDQIYFMRSKELSSLSSACGQIYTSRKTSSSWTTPQKVEIPGNFKCLAYPKIGSDDNTLYFSASTKPNAPMDVFVSKRKNEVWSTPEKIDYLSTTDNDIFLSFNKSSKLVYFSQQGEHTHDLFKGILSPEHRSVQLTELRILAKQNNEAEKSLLSIYNLEDDKLIAKEESRDNGRLSYLLEPGHYLYMLSAEDQKSFTIDTLSIPNPEDFQSILRTPDLTPVDSVYLHANAAEHELFDRLFFHGLLNSMEARNTQDSVHIHIPDSSFFSPIFYEKTAETGKPISFEVDTTLEDNNHLLIVY